MRVVDADRRDRDAGRHLRDREQRVEAVEHAEARAQRDADHRQVGVRRDRAGQRGREAGAADEHAQAALAGGPRVLGDRIRRAVRRAHLELVADARLVEHVRGALHPLAVGLRADEDPDERAVRHAAMSRPELHAGEIYVRRRLVRRGSRLGDRVAGADDVRGCGRRS